jgi:hypothetical protein
MFNFERFRYIQAPTITPDYFGSYSNAKANNGSFPTNATRTLYPWGIMGRDANQTSDQSLLAYAPIKATPTPTKTSTPSTAPVVNSYALPIYGSASVTKPAVNVPSKPAETAYSSTSTSTLPIWYGTSSYTSNPKLPYLTPSMNDIYQTITSRGTVAAEQNSSYWGDPHVADADRANQNNRNASNFIVTGAGTFNLLKDKNISLSAEHKKYDKWKIDVTNQVNLALGDSKLVYNAYGEPTLNGVKLEKDKLMTLSDGSKVTWNGSNKLNVTNANYGEYNLDMTVQTSGNKNADGTNIKYLDTYVTSTNKGVFSDGIMPTGILGEGFDVDNIVRTKLNFGLENYKVS